MNCPNCNNAVPNGADRCPNCGFLINNQPSVLPNPVETPAPAPEVTPNVSPAPTPSPVNDPMPDLTLPDVSETSAPIDAPAVEPAPVAPAPVEPIAPAVVPETPVMENSIAPAPTPEIAPVMPEGPAIEPAPVPQIEPADPEAFKASSPAAPAPVQAPETVQVNPAPIMAAAEPATPATAMPAGPVIEPAPMPQIEVAPAQNTPAPEITKEKKKSPVGLILAILLLLLIVSAGIILYTRGFFDSIFNGGSAPAPTNNSGSNNGSNNSSNNGSNNNSGSNSGNSGSTTPEPKADDNSSSFTIGGYEFTVPEGYELKNEDNKAHLIKSDGSVDIIIVDVYKGTKADLQDIVPQAKEMIEKAGNTYNSSRSGTRSSKYFLNIGYSNSGVDYETIMMLIEDGYILSLTSLKTDGLATDDFINLASTIIDNKTSSSSPNDSLKSVKDAFTINIY